MQTRKPNPMDAILAGKTPRPKKMLIEQIDTKPPQPEPEQIYRIRLASGFILRGRH